MGALAIVTTACGTAAPAATTAPASAAADPFQARWSALIEAAKKEGQLNVVGGPEGSQQDGGWYDAFGKQFGIKVVLSGGNAAEVATRTLAERAQAVYTLDISGQGGTGTQRFLDAKIIDPLTPQIIHPEALDRSKGWFVSSPVWVDPDQTYCQYVGLDSDTNFMEFYYNNTKVSQAEIDTVKSWKDLLDPKWKGRIIIGDIAAGEASRSRTSAWIRLGQTWFDTLLRQQSPKIVAFGDERTYADAVARGEAAIALFPPGVASLDKAIASKLPVARMERTLAEGGLLTGAQRICLIKNAPHPNAAKLLINWTLTKDGQAALNQLTGRQARMALRKDIPQGKVTNDEWQRALKTPYVVDETSKDWQAARTTSQAYIKNVFAELKIVPGK